mmetsp:Transcript_14581/g.37215  ORF Transcript_14581/g.37215 Transcript_14581/m.37215 type:complete len:309 (-) Transcript_14581:351-1277(-)
MGTDSLHLLFFNVIWAVLRPMKEGNESLVTVTSGDECFGLCDVLKVIKFVNNFLANQLLNGILKGYYTKHSVRRILSILIHYVLHKRKVLSLSSARSHEGLEGVIGESRVKLAPAKLQERHDRDVVIRIDQNKIFRVNEPHHFCLVSFIYRNTRVTRVEYSSHGIEVELCISVKHENLVQRCHHILHYLLRKIKCTQKDTPLVVFQVTARLHCVDLYKLFQLIPRINSADFSAKYNVEHVAKWPRQGVCKDDEDLHQPCCISTHSQPITRAQGLRYDFTENSDEKGRKKCADNTIEEIGQKDGEHRVD